MAISAFLDIGAVPGKNPELSLYSRPLPDSAQQIPAVLHHLSSSGVLIECSHKFIAGEQVDVAFSSTAAETGEIRWIGSELYGLQFNRPTPVRSSRGHLRVHIAKPPSKATWRRSVKRLSPSFNGSGWSAV